MNFLNFTFFKNMTTRIKKAYYCLKLRKKHLCCTAFRNLPDNSASCYFKHFSDALSDLRRAEKLESDAVAIRLSD